MKGRSEDSVIARIRLGEPVGDLVTNPHNALAYAALGDSIAVIGSRHVVSSRIPIGGHPGALAIGADGSRLYATNYGGSVSVIDTSDQRVGVIPGACCVQQVDTPDGALLYAAGNAGGGGRISVLAEGGETVDAIDGFDRYAVTALAADPRGRRVYAGLTRRSARYQYDAGRLGVVDTAVNELVRTVGLIGAPDAIAISADGALLYATHYDRACVSAVDLATWRVTPIALGDNPIGLSITPDGSLAYVAARRSLSVIDTVTHDKARLAVGDLPRCARISPDGKHAYVSNFGAGSVSVVDTVAACVTETIDVGNHPEALAVSPDGHRLYVGDYWSGTVTVLSVEP